MLPVSTERRRFPPPTKTQARSSGRTTSRGTGGGTPTTTVERLTASQGQRGSRSKMSVLPARTPGRRSLAAAGKPALGPPPLSRPLPSAPCRRPCTEQEVPQPDIPEPQTPGDGEQRQGTQQPRPLTPATPSQALWLPFLPRPQHSFRTGHEAPPPTKPLPHTGQ